MEATNRPESADLLCKEIFNNPLERRFFDGYRRVFSIAEIEKSPLLQWVFGANLLVFFYAFSSWFYSDAVTLDTLTTGVHRCWPYFQNCGELYFLENLPLGYSQPILYMGFFAVMVLIVFLIWKKEWIFAHILMTLLLVWEVFLIFVLTNALAGNYDYYHVVLTFILLFVPFKLFFLKLILVVFYFLAGTIKIHEGWILGSYFTSLTTGLPIFPDAITPLITNLVIFMQIVGAWFLLSGNPLYQRLALIYFVLFHLYSGILVGYRYPATVLPALLLLFGPMYTKTPVPLSKSALSGWLIVVLLFVFQSLPFIISGDQKITLEGNKYGLYMFEANHQCISTAHIFDQNNISSEERRESESSRNRCDPYARWFRLQQLCTRDPSVTRIAWTFDHSINGGPFYRIVDVEDMCVLEYKPFSHNEWIVTPEKGAPAIGRPVKNVYY